MKPSAAAHRNWKAATKRSARCKPVAPATIVIRERSLTTDPIVHSPEGHVSRGWELGEGAPRWRSGKQVGHKI